ncbi:MULTISPECIES: YsnF/AvaK domain-containing protein [unclassified Rathayibacter]|uniref:YsnF/AvaK domain-containing protein n=1 Tax=unclassified Rathayibacter TaxID=2609250 RepID=UPI0010E4D99B|nr:MULTISPECIES: YsnF/AvaK domain-containing protein [unclassified Rathayibacter]TCL79366.1 uncharacterized protein (TIGR02271 family) [Rathayibacter sp. PhB192]TCM25366.1 uncharacterized protein (TIGR02271 family) [Rathayibacter sp. PhB179]
MSTTPPEPAADVILREERLDVSTERYATERVTIERIIVTEQRTITVEVRHEEIRITREAVDEEPVFSADASAHPDPLVVILHEEQINLTKAVVPVERVTVQIHTVAQHQHVTETLGHEVIDIDRTPTPTDRFSSPDATTPEGFPA